MSNAIKIIYLNGSTSAGKTTLARMLQAQLPQPYMHIGIDSVTEMMPVGINDFTGGFSEQGFWLKKQVDAEGVATQLLQLGPYAQKVMNTLRDLVITLANKGHNVIVDDVSLTEEGYARWREEMAPFNTLFVGLIAPTEVLEKREIKRGDRMIGAARAENALVHMNKVYDVFLDTHQLSMQACVEIIRSALEQRATAPA